MGALGMLVLALMVLAGALPAAVATVLT